MAKSWNAVGRTRRERIADSYARFTEPLATGLPNWRVVWWFPAVIALGAILLVAFNVSGTSSGAHFLTFGTGEDPRSVLGSPRTIRSDEWLVQQGWIVSQIQQGFPVFNQTLPGGMDTTVLNELPNTDWSTVFRPHMWGYLLFGLDAGTAWQWWVPAFGLVTGAYLLVVTLLPRRAITAAVIACVVFFSPIFQWWYGPNALWPAAWSLLAMAGTVWMLRDGRLWLRIVWGVVLGWLAVTMAIGVYVPFIVPSILVFLFFFVGSVLQERPWVAGGWRRLLRQLSPLLIAGAAAGAVVLLYVRTRASTIEAITSTVYPGERSDPTGQIFVSDPFLAGWAGAPFGQSFHASGVPTLLGPNPSEAASAILLAVFVAPGLLWLVVRAWRAERRLNWVAIASLVGLGIVLAFHFVPGWDAIARLLLLDKVPLGRFRMGFAVMLPLFFALVAREVDRSPSSRRNWPLAAIGGAIAAGLSGYVLFRLQTLDPATFSVIPLWPVSAVAIVAATVLLFFKRTIAISAVLLLLASGVIGAAVNPLYRGAYDLNDTAVGQRVLEIDEADPGTWVGIGHYETMAVLVESGVSAYAGVQAYPPAETWAEIDPTGRYEDEWNRLGHVRWEFGYGEPVVENPQNDVIESTFDACSDFAQENVDYVIADVEPPRDSCLVQLDDVAQGNIDIQIYEVVAPS